MSEEKEAIKQLKKLTRKQELEGSRLGRLFRWSVFKFGFSQCRYCIYCNADGSNYRELTESILLINGKCKWSADKVSGNLEYRDLRVFHRCPAFIPMLYNFKGYALDPEEVKKISAIRFSYFFQILIALLGWIAAVLVAIFKK